MAEYFQINDLELSQQNGYFVTKAGSCILTSPNGNIIKSATTKLHERIVSDFENQGEIIVENGYILQPRVFSAYVLASSKIDFFEQSESRYPKELPAWLMHDPVFDITAGHPICSNYQISSQSFIADFMEEYNLKLKPFQKYNEEEKLNVISFFCSIVAQFNAAEQSVLVNMAWEHEKHFVATILWILGLCTARQWATVVFARSSDVGIIAGSKQFNDFISVPLEKGNDSIDEEIEFTLSQYMTVCDIAKNFLEAVQE